MTDEWGSSHLKDATARIEKKIEASVGRLSERIALAGDSINRPPGTLRVSPNDQREEFLRKIQSPDEMAKVYADAVARLGEGDAEKEYVEWVEKMIGETDG